MPSPVVMTKNMFCFTIDTANPTVKIGDFGDFQVFQNPAVHFILKDWTVLSMSQSTVGTVVYVSVLCEKVASGY